MSWMNWRITVETLPAKWNDVYKKWQEDFEADIEIEFKPGYADEFAMPWSPILTIEGEEAVLTGEAHPHIGTCVTRLKKEELDMFIRIVLMVRSEKISEAVFLELMDEQKMWYQKIDE